MLGMRPSCHFYRQEQSGQGVVGDGFALLLSRAGLGCLLLLGARQRPLEVLFNPAQDTASRVLNKW